MIARGKAETLQRAYYARTAAAYDDYHVNREPEHNIALQYISCLLGQFSIKSVLDVGCGTGRGIRQLRENRPGLRVMGLDPVAELLEVAATKGISRAALIRGDARALPFPDQRFDAVVELGILHHVADPETVVREMLRVAKRAVCVSDCNLFGQGAASLRVLKFLIYQFGLWNIAKYIQTRGRGYFVTENDGVAYSYSVYSQYALLSDWADRMIVVSLATDVRPSRRLLPPLDASHVLLCAIRDERA